MPLLLIFVESAYQDEKTLKNARKVMMERENIEVDL
jgi:hypothetical protein